jgi:hypothetical protein
MCDSAELPNNRAHSSGLPRTLRLAERLGNGARTPATSAEVLPVELKPLRKMQRGLSNGEGASGAAGGQVRGTLSSVPHRSVTADSPVRECSPALPNPVMRGESPSQARAGPLAADSSLQQTQRRDLAAPLPARLPGGPAQCRPRHRKGRSREYRVPDPPPRTTLPTPANASANRATMWRGRRNDSAAHGPPAVGQDPAAPNVRASQATGPAAPPAADSRTTGPAGLCAPGLI